MAHHPIFGSDPQKPVAPAAGERESDLAELAAKFAAHGGGRVSPELSADLALEIVLNEIVEQACLATGAGGAAIVLERGGEWVCRASAGGNSPQLGARLDTEAGLSGACVKTRKVQRCDDAQADPRADIEACRILGVRSVIILPLLLNGELAGVFEVFSARASAFGERDERTLEALCQRVLKNLRRSSEAGNAGDEPLFASGDRMLAGAGWVAAVSANPGSVDPVSVNPVSADPVSVDPVSVNPVSINRIPVGPVAVNPPSANAVSVNAVSGDVQNEPADLFVVEMEQRERRSRRRMDVVTWALGVVVLACALLLGARVAMRLGGERIAASQGRRGNSGTASGSTAYSAGTSEAAKGISTVGAKANSITQAKKNGASAEPMADADVPAGSLLIYEKGKEVFRLPPASAEAEKSKAGGQVQRASGVEAAPVVQLSPGEAEDSLVHRVEPIYPEEALQRQFQGAVVLEVRIGSDGGVEDVKVVSGRPVLAEAATSAVKQWRFKTHEVGGHPAEMQTRITINFRLPH
jgi:TonB family protein